MPTEAKKTRLKTSRSGMMSDSAWWLYSDSLSSRPATKAPSAADSPTVCAAKPTPSASAVTTSRKSSRDPLRATRSTSHGNTRPPTKAHRARKAAALPTRDRDGRHAAFRAAEPRQHDHHRDHGDVLHDQHAEHDAARERAHAPLRQQRLDHDDGAREREQGAEPDGRDPVEPEHAAERHAEPIVSRIWMGVPNSATRRTGARSLNDSSSPRPKSSSVTPMSASSSMLAASRRCCELRPERRRRRAGSRGSAAGAAGARRCAPATPATTTMVRSAAMPIGRGGVSAA